MFKFHSVLSGFIKKHQNKKKYFLNISWLTAEQVLKIIIGLSVGVYVARYLGPTHFGVLSYVVAMTGLFNVFCKLGLDSIVVRDLVNFKTKSNLYLGTAFWLKCLSGTFCFALSLTLLALSEAREINLYIALIVFSLILQSFEVIDFYFQSKVLSKFISISKIIQMTLSALIKIILIFYQASLVWFIVIYLFDQIILSVLYFLMFKKQNGQNFYRFFNIKIAKKMLLESWPLILSAFSVTLYMRIDQLLINHFLGSYQVGIYSVAVRLIEVWFFIPGLIMATFFPVIVNAKKLNSLIYHQRLGYLFSLTFWITFPISLVAAVFPSKIIYLLYGSTFLEAAQVLSVTAWILVFMSFGVITNHWYLVEKMSKFSLYRSLITMGIAIVLNTVLIQKMGLMGAAYGTLISYIISGYAFDLLNKKTFNQFLLKTVSPIILLLKK